MVEGELRLRPQKLPGNGEGIPEERAPSQALGVKMRAENLRDAGRRGIVVPADQVELRALPEADPAFMHSDDGAADRPHILGR